MALEEFPRREVARGEGPGGAGLEEARLAALVEGALTPAEAAEIEAAAAADPDLAARIESLKQLREPAPESPPAKFPEMAGDARPASAGLILDMAEARATRQRRRRLIAAAARWAGLAAALAAAFAFGRALAPAPGIPSSLIATSPSAGLKAEGALSAALEGGLVATQASDAPVKIGVSFRAHDGDLCRTFMVRQARPLAGLACRAPEGWRVRLAVEAPAGADGALGVGPAAVLEAVDQTIQGVPLDAAGEAQARAAHWRAGP